MGDLYQETLTRSNTIKEAGYNLIEMWECVWKKSPEYGNSRKKITEDVESLTPRDAFYGGRMEVFKVKCENKNTKYIDVCSLYPTVQYYDEYPVGHPTKITKPGPYNKNWFGIIKCKVQAPYHLYIPVLPARVNGKLIFPLCIKCAIENNQSTCSHTNVERQFTGTWSTIEVSKAVDKGYTVVEVRKRFLTFKKKFNIELIFVCLFVNRYTKYGLWKKVTNYGRVT